MSSDINDELTTLIADAERAFWNKVWSDGGCEDVRLYKQAAESIHQGEIEE